MPEYWICLNDTIVSRFTIDEGASLVVGRGTDADVILDNTAISRHHTRLTLQSGILMAEDLGSLNGTFVNGVRIQAATAVGDDDTLAIGKFTVVAAGAAGMREAVSQALPTDLDEETVFVGRRPPRQPHPPDRKTPPRRDSRRLMVIAGNGRPAELDLAGRTTVKLGRDPGADIHLPGWFIGKAQCYIVLRDGGHLLIPQRGWIKTRLNDRPVTEEQRLCKGDIIGVRGHRIRYE